MTSRAVSLPSLHAVEKDKHPLTRHFQIAILLHESALTPGFGTRMSCITTVWND